MESSKLSCTLFMKQKGKDFLNIHRNSIYGLPGPNGAGKYTTYKNLKVRAPILMLPEKQIDEVFMQVIRQNRKVGE